MTQSCLTFISPSFDICFATQVHLPLMGNLYRPYVVCSEVSTPPHGMRESWCAILLLCKQQLHENGKWHRILKEQSCTCLSRQSYLRPPFHKMVVLLHRGELFHQTCHRSSVSYVHVFRIFDSHLPSPEETSLKRVKRWLWETPHLNL